MFAELPILNQRSQEKIKYLVIISLLFKYTRIFCYQNIKKLQVFTKLPTIIHKNEIKFIKFILKTLTFRKNNYYLRCTYYKMLDRIHFFKSLFFTLFKFCQCTFCWPHETKASSLFKTTLALLLFITSAWTLCRVKAKMSYVRKHFHMKNIGRHYRR